MAGATPTTDLLGAVDVTRNQFATTGTPRYLIPCGRVESRLDLPTTTGVTYGYSYGEGTATVTAEAEQGWVITGQRSWMLPLVKQSCEGIVSAPTFVDKPGTYHDKLVIPKAVDPVRGYEVNGQYMPAGEHSLMTGTVTVAALFEDDVAPMTWRHTCGIGGIIDVYTTPGEHVVNGRRWDTRCEPYSTTTRCFTNIWATTVEQRGSTFHQSNGWVFNNLTYMPIPRKQWGSNPLANNGAWTAADARQWRTECDTPKTGRNGCRSWIQARVVVASPRTGGGYSYRWETREILNNIVRFG
ncbi:hypothetical protein [Tessaracoccus antarcticus]|uniref:hypothetical protein n=1 Tax=Tessaracoccus antarcticus TaxID=2479848 RepID=UPI001313E281|nr:hypothetical protein [Tessaracoccus antarcticus]